jgi:CBS domain-containing protein
MATDVTTFSPDMEILRAMEMLLEKKFSGAPVVDENGRLVGVLSKKDCLKAALNASYHQEWGGAVADYMSNRVETLDADLDLVAAAERFLASHYRRFPVMEGGRMIGQISRADLLRALVECWR